MTSRGEGRWGGQSLVISSLQNERIKLIRSLSQRKTRRETGLFVVEGAEMLMRARRQGWVPTILVRGPDAHGHPLAAALKAWADHAKADVLDVTLPVLEKLGSADNPQQLIAVVTQRWCELPDPLSISAEVTWLALEGIRDPGNLGTILRTAEAAGVAGVILVGDCCDPFSREAVRGSVGSLFAVPIARADAESFLAWLQSWPGDVVATRLEEGEDYRAAEIRHPALVVMGSERDGLSAALAEASTRHVRIPMAGEVESLNLAVATALVLYQVRARWLG